MNLVFSLLTDTSSSKFKEVMAIYLDLFPASERQLPEVIVERIASGRVLLLIAEAKNQVVGFAMLWNFGNSGFALLDYLAVAKNWQSMRIGLAIMKEIKRIASSWCKDLILEIERPGEGDNLAIREKRLRFYLQNDALVLSQVPYIMPALDGTISTPMLLLAIPQSQRKSYSGKEIKSLIQNIYAQVYQKEPDDPELQFVTNSIPETVDLILV